MKKVLLLLTAGLVAATANGQYMHEATTSHAQKIPFVHAAAVPHTGPTSHHSGARTTTTSFVTDNFGTGSPTSLPTGWTAGTITGGTWKWTHHASTSAFAMDTIKSSTAFNGWMIFDSDSIGAACSCAPAGWLQSPPYNCSTHPWVRANFQSYYRKFEDSCYLWVSGDPTFSTHSSFAVHANNDLSTNTFSANPTNVHVNISSAAGGQPTVYVRFVTWGPDLGAYSWMVDDFTLSDLDSVDIGLSSPSILYFPGADVGSYSFGAMPSKMADTVIPVTYVSNYGHTALPSVGVNATVYQGLTSVYTASVTVNQPVDAFDTIGAPLSYYSNAIASYTVPFSVNPAADAVTANNVDTGHYDITDSVWSENPPGSFASTTGYVYRPGLAFSPGTQFVVPAGQSDTLTSVSVAFGSNTKPGQKVCVQIFHYDGTSWVYDGLTQQKTLAAADISTLTGVTYATFMVDEVGSSGKIILNGQTGGVNYAAVVKGISNTDTVTVLEGDNPAPYAIVGFTGLADTSDNASTPTLVFGQGHLPFGNETTPFINMNFGVVQYHEGVPTITNNNIIGKAYPNPANTMVSIPFTMAQDAVVTTTLSNVMGQVISTQSVNATGGKATKATFATTGLPDGVYLYSVEVNGQHTNGRIVVAH